MKFLLIITCSIFITSCQYNPHADKFLTVEPNVSEVVGIYELQEAYVDMVNPSLNDRILSTSPKPIITLRADGTATLKQFPFFEELDTGFDYAFKGFEDINAHWKISAVGSVSFGADDTKTVYGVLFTLPDGGVLFDSPTLTGNTTVDGLIFTLYDGDQGQILGYQKSKLPNNTQ
tara:strand:- start:146 stop:670 length:525 start_codon:yes stop_codon:yes gene_type:complete